MLAKTAAVAATALLLACTVLGSGWITYEAEGAGISDPFSVKAAPHFSDATFLLSRPSFAEAFDSDTGGFSVSTGTPTVDTGDSMLTVTTPDEFKCELTLNRDDAPGINTTVRNHIEVRISVADVLTQYTNLSVWNDLAEDFAAISIHASSFHYAYNAGASLEEGAIASPAVKGTWYRIAIELTSSGVTFYVKNDAWQTLGTHYANDGDLRVARVTEVRFSVDGKESGSASLDNMFCSDSNPQSASSSGTTYQIDALSTDTAYQHDRVNVEPLKFARTTSGSAAVNQAFGIGSSLGDLLEQPELNASQFLQLYGQVPETGQKYQGDYYAQGWQDFRGEVEAALKAKIALDQHVMPDQVFLVDYYIEDLEIKTAVDWQLQDKVTSGFIDSLRHNANGFGAKVQTVRVSALQAVMGLDIYNPGSHLPSLDSTINALGFVASPTLSLLLSAKASIEQTLKNPPPDLMDRVGAIISKTIQDAVNATGEELTALVMAALAEISSLTTSVFAQINSTFGAGFSMISTSLNATIKAYDDALQQVQQAGAMMYANMQQQWQATNAMWSQLFDNQQRYFDGQLAKSNEAVQNISREIFNGSLGSNFWSDFLGGGKPASGTPLSQIAWFGKDLTTVAVVLIVFVVLIAAMLLVFMGSRKRRRRHK